MVRLYFPKLQESIDKLRAATADIRTGARVTVGIHQDADNYFLRKYAQNCSAKKKGNPSKEFPSVAEYAAWNHFGTAKIPARPFLDVAIKKNLNEIIEAGKENFSETRNLGLTVDAMGLYAVGAIQRYIAEGVPPPNAESTIKRKKSSRPLIDNGIMWQAITFRRINGK